MGASAKSRATVAGNSTRGTAATSGDTAAERATADSGANTRGAKPRATGVGGTAAAKPLPPESPADRVAREAFIQLYLASGRFSGEVEKVCRDEGVAMSHFTMMWFLARRDDAGERGPGVPMGAVIDGHLNRASDATRLADRLCDLGFVERLASPTDRRVVLVRLTRGGREVFERLAGRIRDLHRAQFAPLDDKEMATLNRLLAKALWGPDAGSHERHPLIAAAGGRR